MQDENRRVRRGGVNFFQGRHAALSELKLAPAADYAHPLTRRRALCLVFQHPQSVRKGRHTIPAQLDIVVQPATNDVQVRIVQTRNYSSSFKINDLRIRSGLIFFRVVHADDAAILNGKISRFRTLGIERRDAPVMNNQIWRGVGIHTEVFLSLECSQPCSARVTSGMTTQVRRATMQPLKTTLLGINGQGRIAAPSVRFKIAAVGKTPTKVAKAIFQRGGGLCGERNHASSPCKGRALHESFSVSD